MPYGQSGFLQGLDMEEYSFIRGIDQSVAQQHEIFFTRRRLYEFTDTADGVSFRKGNVQTDGFGFAALPFSPTSALSGYNTNGSPGLGIFQTNVTSLSTAPSNFPIWTMFDVQQSSGDPTLSIDQWLLGNPGSQTNIGTIAGTANQFPLCAVDLNGLCFVANGNFFYKFNPGSAPVFSAVLQQGTAPTIATASGVLSGYYAYCYTLVDAFGNESQPSPLVATGNLSSNEVSTSINLAGMQAASYGWKKIRYYRTLSQSAAVTASQNPIFYHLPGLDQTIFTSISTYGQTDNLSDATISVGSGIYQLSNVAYVDGSLQALGTDYIPKFIVNFQNQLFGFNWVNSSSSFPTLIQWSNVSDNSQNSAANGLSWNTLNNISADEDNKEIIGAFAGLGGRLFVYKTNGTYQISPTGNTTGVQFTIAKIENAHGFYHHSQAEIGGAVIGRVKDGIAIFNGASYKIISNPIKEFLKQCVNPEFDSGVFDTNQQRYYLAVTYTGTVGNYEGTTPSGGTLPMVRNAVIAYDLPSQTFELHMNCPIQKFGKMVDSFTKEKIFAVGVNSDIFVITNAEFYGATYSIPTPSSFGTNYFQYGSSTVPEGFLNSLVSIPYFVDVNGNLNFIEWKATIKSFFDSFGVHQVFFDQNIPSGNATFLSALIPNNFGTVSSATSSSFTDNGNNSFGSQLTGYSFNRIVSKAFSANDANTAGMDVTSATVLTDHTGSIGFTMNAGDNYQLFPFKQWNTVNINQDAIYSVFKTPPFGAIRGDQQKKQFRYLKIKIMGSAPWLRIRTYINGSKSFPSQVTADQTLYVQINSSTQYTEQLIPLAGHVGNTFQFDFGIPKGSGWFQCDVQGVYYRRLGSLRGT